MPEFQLRWKHWNLIALYPVPLSRSSKPNVRADALESEACSGVQRIGSGSIGRRRGIPIEWVCLYFCSHDRHICLSICSSVFISLLAYTSGYSCIFFFLTVYTCIYILHLYLSIYLSPYPLIYLYTYMDKKK